MNVAKAYALISRGAALKITVSDYDLMARKLREECEELCEAIESTDPVAIRDELGDVLICLARVSFHLCIGLDDALRVATQKLTLRFTEMERDLKARNVNIDHLSTDEALSRYKSAKKRTG